ncbi:C-GCAxxG-C-C family (seleno)protein [Lentisphaerota bacterium ZTH]|nr:C-GCAxxG-C-C family protein [Lentisphaerota bacterium]WET05732.1 C-GCAxxG-C-C family (seleno)protein [Lentisphaerota bacterium ZTH]
MNKKKASDFFHNEDNLNCAQAVLKFFEDNEIVSDELIAQNKAFGGGRAPEGTCGALYGAMQLLQSAEHNQKAKEFFIKYAGSFECRAIKEAGKISCAKCVDLAADFLDKVSGHDS